MRKDTSDQNGQTKRGRKPKMDAQRFETVRLAVQGGSYTVAALGLIGVSKTAFYRWLALPENTEYRDALRNAEARAEVVAVSSLVKAAAGGDWRAGVEYLQRKHPDRWSKITKLDVADIPNDTLMRLLGIEPATDADRYADSLTVSESYETERDADGSESDRQADALTVDADAR